MSETERELTLIGGPADVPERLTVAAEQVGDGRLRVERLGGYEHYEQHPADDFQSGQFVWTRRTRIAE